jgi:hypothetical protein
MVKNKTIRFACISGIGLGLMIISVCLGEWVVQNPEFGKLLFIGGVFAGLLFGIVNGYLDTTYP